MTGGKRWADAVRHTTREHLAVTVLVGIAAVPRLLVEAAFWPATYYSDSLAYLRAAEVFPIGILASRPSGYPLALKLLTLDGHVIGTATIAQHVAGLATGVISYALLLRLGARRWLAVTAAALILFDGYAIALEQFVLAEATFGLALMLSLFLATGKERGRWTLAASGVLLAFAATCRTVGLVAVPVWAIYLIWTHRSARALLPAAAGVLLPILAYAALFAVKTGTPGLSGAGGWFLYGRVGQIADCDVFPEPAEARRLCEPHPEAANHAPDYYLWTRRSPAVRLFGPIASPQDPHMRRSNRVLKEFAVAVIRHRPGAYSRLVAGDFLRFFRPGQMSPGQEDETGLYLTHRGPSGSSDRDDREKVPAPTGLAGAMVSYERALHTPRWLLGPLALLSLLAVVFPKAIARRPEIFLLSGAALSMLLASVAISGFILRYLIPLVPPLVCGGALACQGLYDALSARAPRNSRSASVTPSGSSSTR